MRLLVSVRSAAEVPAVLAGGGDIVDAKEPRHGSLGAVEPAVLREIAAAVPGDVPLSVALGDIATPAAAAAAIAGLPPLTARRAPTYIKVGFAGASPADIAPLLEAAVLAAGARRNGGWIVAVAYADHVAAGVPDPEAIARAAAAAGAHGVLVDTRRKDSGDLLDWLPRGALDAWVARARGMGLLTAIAGSLRGVRLALAARCGADVVGVRGAACRGGRSGRVAADLVGAARRKLRPDVPSQLTVVQ